MRNMHNFLVAMIFKVLIHVLVQTSQDFAETVTAINLKCIMCK